MNRNIRIALAVCQSMVGDTPGNLARMETLAAAAEQKGAEIVCFPELSVTGYHVHKAIKSAAQPLPGPASEKIEAMAARHGVSIIAGMAEKAGDRIFAAQFCAEPEKGITAVYRKLHLGPPEKKLFTPGDTLPPLFNVRGLRFGIQLCYDAHFPELSTAMAVNGADVIFMPHASPGRDADEKLASWMRHMPARAFDNGVYVAAVNAVGDNGHGLGFPGVAVLFSPSGKLLENHTGQDEALVIADLRPDVLKAVREHPMKYFLPNRRPEIYYK